MHPPKKSRPDGVLRHEIEQAERSADDAQAQHERLTEKALSIIALARAFGVKIPARLEALVRKQRGGK